ncbi:MAG TPA: F0F1 ATP synthase subunit A [Bryobacteraceae bacterium]|jgi:F-type H+-transporting ATPase subunit a|nr:F0F1 ATP synthase subunit A [Bryobacteraceae bacterium]
MPEHEIWLTRLFNDHLAGLGNWLLALVRVHAENPARPWANFITMQLLVAAIIIVVFAYLRPRLSMDRPGKTQHTFEVIYTFLHGEANDNIGHEGPRFLPFLGTLFIFILFCNLIGIIPGFESPTMNPSVPAGCAVLVFVYYNFMGFKQQGVFKYMAHFAGPMPLLAPLMIPIELISHMARPLSLTIRLFANMLAGEKVTVVFLGLTYLVAPAVFMGLHVFVSFLQAYIFVLLTMMYLSETVPHEQH